MNLTIRACSLRAVALDRDFIEIKIDHVDTDFLDQFDLVMILKHFGKKQVYKAIDAIDKEEYEELINGQE